jgi:hypothetical protein
MPRRDHCALRHVSGERMTLEVIVWPDSCRMGRICSVWPSKHEGALRDKRVRTPNGWYWAGRERDATTKATLLNPWILWIEVEPGKYVTLWEYLKRDPANWSYAIPIRKVAVEISISMPSATPAAA